MAWVRAVIQEIQDQKCDRPIIVRAHPLSLNYPQEFKFLNQVTFDDPQVTFIVDASPLDQWLENCHVGITYCSGSCYDLLLNGIPCITYNSGSFAWLMIARIFTILVYLTGSLGSIV